MPSLHPRCIRVGERDRQPEIYIQYYVRHSEDEQIHYVLIWDLCSYVV